MDRAQRTRIQALQTLLICALAAALSGVSRASAQTAQSTASPAVEPLWAEAAAAQRHQQYLQAASIYRKLLQLKPDFVEAEVNLGLMLQLAGNLQEANESFEHVLRRHPDLFAPNLLAGLNYLKLDDPERALPFLQRAVREQPDKIEARLGLANGNLQLKKYPEALEQFTQAAQLSSTNAEAWTGLGASYLSMEKDLESELRQVPSTFRTTLLAESYLQQGKTQKAVDSLRAVATAEPGVPCARTMLGIALLQDSKFDEAAQQFGQDWNARTGGCLLARLGVASLRAKQGEAQKALRELQETASIDPAFVKANADVYFGSLSAAGAEDAVRQIPGSDAEAKSSSASVRDPMAAMREGRYSACSAALAEKSRLDFRELRALALCSYYSGNDTRVLTATGAILKQLPADPEALYWRIQAVERLGMSALTKAAEINPDSASLHALTGDLFYAKGDLAEAAVEYRKAIALKPAFLAAHLALARALNADRKTDEAEREIRFVLNSNPDDAEANYLMGEILVDRSDFDGALPYLLHARQASPDELPYVHADLGKVYEERGQIAQAIAELKLAVPVDVDGSYHYRLGHLYMRAGDRASAAAALQIAENLRHQTDVNSLYQK